MLLRSIVAASLFGTSSAAWNGNVLDATQVDEASLSKSTSRNFGKGFTSGIEVAFSDDPYVTLLGNGRLDTSGGCDPPQEVGDGKRLPNDGRFGALPMNSLRITDNSGVSLVLDPANSGGKFLFAESGFDESLSKCTLTTTVNGHIVSAELSGANCNWGIYLMLVKGGPNNYASYTYTKYCSTVEGTPVITGGRNYPVRKYVIGFKKFGSDVIGDPIITTFDGVQYRVDIAGSFVNTRWHDNQHQITSCFYSPKEPAVFTRAMSYKCGKTTMVAHLSQFSLENWQTDLTPVKFNVYYFDESEARLLNNTGDFGNLSVVPGEYTAPIESRCPLDTAQVSLTVSTGRNNWQNEKGMVLLNSRIRLLENEDGEVADVHGGLSQSITGFITDPSKVETAFGWTTDENARFYSGPNTRGEICAKEGMKYTMDHNAFLESNCGATSWAVQDQVNVFNRLARIPGAYVQSCELQDYIHVY